MLQFKDGVRLNVKAPAIRIILDVLEDCSRRSSVRACLASDDLTITSGHDGVHGPGSRHYLDEALDLRVHNIRPEKRVWLWNYLTAAFDTAAPGKFTVLYESPTTANAHMHIQVTKGERYP